MPIHPKWSDSEEEEKDLNKKEEEKGKEEEEDLDYTIKTKDTEIYAPQLTDALVDKAPEREEQKNDLCDSNDSEFFEDDSDDNKTIHNIV